MTNKIVVALACLGFAASAGAEVNFDQNLDVKSVVDQAKSVDVKSPYPGYGPHRVRYSRECKNFGFAPSPFAQSSGREYISSTEYIEECRFIPAPPNPPLPPPPPRPNKSKAASEKDYYPGQPGYPGYNGNDYGPHGDYDYPGNFGGQQGQWHCRERIGQVFRATAQVNLAPRQLFPWESESFAVCMEGQRVDFETRNSPYSYSVDRQGLFDLTFNLTPNYRRPTPPDASGLNLSSFAFRDGKFVMAIGDRWAAEYAGEKVEIQVELMKDGFLFFNSSKGKKTFTLDTAASYELAFNEGDLVKDKDFVDDSGDMRGPKKFYVKWGFRRIGSISTNDYMKKGDTDKITQ